MLQRYSEEDRLLTSPGAAAFRTMLGEQPTLILVDELPSYVRKVNALLGNAISNIQQVLYDLIEAVTSAPKAALVITAPDRNADAFQEEAGTVHDIIDEAQRIIGRRAHDMTPTAPSDVPAILRRRLFTGCDEHAREETAKRLPKHLRQTLPQPSGRFHQPAEGNLSFPPGPTGPH